MSQLIIAPFVYIIIIIPAKHPNSNVGEASSVRKLSENKFLRSGKVWKKFSWPRSIVWYPFHLKRTSPTSILTNSKFEATPEKIVFPRNQLKIKDSEETNIIVKKSSSRFIDLHNFSPNGRNPLKFRGVFHFCLHVSFYFLYFLYLFTSHRQNILLPNYSPY